MSHPATLPGTSDARIPVPLVSSVNRSGYADFGIRPLKFRALIRRSLARWTSPSPIPPMPDMYGSTTFSAAAVATAASIALPPCISILRPALRRERVGRGNHAVDAHRHGPVGKGVHGRDSHESSSGDEGSEDGFKLDAAGRPVKRQGALGGP